MRFVSRIENEARKAAEVVTIDEERKRAFIKGAEFAADYLLRVMSVSPQEPGGVTKFLNKLRLKDVREALSHLLQRIDDKEGLEK